MAEQGGAKGKDKKAEQVRFKILRDLVHFIVGQEKGVARGFIKGSLDYAHLEEKNAQKKAAVHGKTQQKRAKGLAGFLQRFEATTTNAAKMGQDIATGIGAAFETFVVSLKKGEKSLLDAMAMLGKALLKAVINAIGDELINKAVIYLLIALSLLAGIFTAGLSVTFFISAAYLMAIGIGLKLLSAAFLAKGGLVVSPTLAMVGEGGQPEVVIPADRFAEFGLGGGLDLSRLKLSFPDVTHYGEASNPAFHKAVAGELQAAYQLANQRMN